MSGIVYSEDISINFLELLFGDMSYPPAIPVLKDCILLPKIEPDFMENNQSSNQNNSFSRTKSIKKKNIETKAVKKKQNRS